MIITHLNSVTRIKNLMYLNLALTSTKLHLIDILHQLNFIDSTSAFDSYLLCTELFNVIFSTLFLQ